ncbi:MAG: hypothetical protein JNM72_14435 [Deltaproteobacteria bacterium]|jgi:hypothetical protein|nr:hypothetical protein [Deltaproteobacteria bacterium]
MPAPPRSPPAPAPRAAAPPPAALVKVELRREDQQPPCWSVRFEVAEGVAWLRLPGGWGRNADSAARSGAASGLRLSDLQQVDLMLRQGGGPWSPWRVVDGIDPHGLPLGRWVTLDAPISPAAEDVLYEELVLIDAMEDPTDWEGESGELEETITELGRPSLQPVPGAAAPDAPASLVRALVLRIRQQEREIAALREQLLKLGATPRSDAG